MVSTHRPVSVHHNLYSAWLTILVLPGIEWDWRTCAGDTRLPGGLRTFWLLFLPIFHCVLPLLTLSLAPWRYAKVGFY